ncbi:hypothetical protein [Actinoplanes sp. NPDC051494]|uniref:hypothetical protein n=1 Tax=Actinoplanes sp. NPDC051494 TaxID=3363907 RepID=UPI0037B1C11E
MSLIFLARRWLPAAVAAALAGVVLVGERSEREPVAPPARVEALILRDGAAVEATGMIQIDDAGGARFCAPAPEPIGGGFAACEYAVRLTGIDLRPGSARVRGIWRDGALAATALLPPGAGVIPPPEPESGLPCAAPRGGWAPPAAGGDGLAELDDYVERVHPEQFRRPWVTYPGGIQVMVVETVAEDPSRAEAALRSRVPGNLCVVSRPGSPSVADQNAVGAALSMFLDLGPETGVYLWAPGDVFRIEMVALTPEIAATLSRVGFAMLDPQPWLRPV